MDHKASLNATLICDNCTIVLPISDDRGYVSASLRHLQPPASAYEQSTRMDSSE
jgi:hypothetical protein